MITLNVWGQSLTGYLSLSQQEELFEWYKSFGRGDLTYYNYIRPAVYDPNEYPIGYIELEDDLVEIALLKFSFLRPVNETR